MRGETTGGGWILSETVIWSCDIFFVVSPSKLLNKHLSVVEDLLTLLSRHCSRVKFSYPAQWVHNTESALMGSPHHAWCQSQPCVLCGPWNLMTHLQWNINSTRTLHNHTLRWWMPTLPPWMYYITTNCKSRMLTNYHTGVDRDDNSTTAYYMYDVIQVYNAE